MAETAVAVEPAAPTKQENIDNFEAAFAQITAEDNKPAEAPKAAAPAAPATPAEPAKAPETAPATPAEAEGLPPTPAEEAAAAKVASDAAATTAKAKEPTISDDDLLTRLGGLLKKAPAEPEPAPETQQAEPQSPFTQDEATFLDSYVKEFPDIAKAEALIRRSEYKHVVGYVFAEVAREIQPLVQMVKTLSERTHLGDLQTAVPTYAADRDQVIAWVDKQPAYLKSAYQHVVKAGTVEEVSDLIRRFKAENPGTAAPAVNGSAPAAAPKPNGELSPEVKKAAAALAPVSTKRTNVVVPADKSDFASAFAFFDKEL